MLISYWLDFFVFIYDEHVVVGGEIKLYNEWWWRTLAAATANGCLSCRKRYFSESASAIRFSLARRFWNQI